ncbi:MAG: hypothetical protein HLUCCX14_13620 [Marinobacter excellens HL-55]|uniref:Uncharacterized protein n=1 Tax=Marinobacter excellens HL-55 TaxID=1305731 RepID=A0A0P8B2K0_9GAMM|nr:MAG: hypothetical protein HLUCCX14_13620 [Marinobacter excellens HL-55]
MHGLQHGFGVKAFARVDHGGAVGNAAQVAHHHAEAVVQGHGDHQAVVLGQALAFAHKIAVVEDVVVGEGGAFGVAGGAGGELDVDGVIKLQLVLALAEIGFGHVTGETDELFPGPHAVVFVVVHVDDCAKVWQVIGFEFAGGAALQFRGQLVDHFPVVGGFEAVCGHQGGDASQVEGVLQLVYAVGRVDVHQDGADFGGGELGNGPLVTVGRPDAHPVAAFDADGQEGTGGFVDLVDKLFVGPAYVLVQAYQGVVVGKFLGGAVKHVADGHAQQGLVGDATGVAWESLAHVSASICFCN